MKLCSSIVFALTTSLLWFPGAQAQDDPPQRIIDECLRGCEASPEMLLRRQAMEEWRETQSIAIPVPGFRPGDEENKYYFIRHFGQYSVGGSAARIDSDGVLHGTRPARWTPEGEVVAAEHFYIHSQDYLTGENRYSFDLENFPLMNFVRSLGASLRELPPPGTFQRGEPPEGMLHLSLPEPLYRDRIVQEMHGQHLSFNETLDLLRVASGCDVLRVGDELVIDRCG